MSLIKIAWSSPSTYSTPRKDYHLDVPSIQPFRSHLAWEPIIGTPFDRASPQEGIYLIDSITPGKG